MVVIGMGYEEGKDCGCSNSGDVVMTVVIW